ncbi:MAG: membrane-associated protease RseP (regulator of RpoE activity) [Myxococcota bacterium]|jgi:membrane-associated protease RseP (regulator of RpoE activity)
MNSSFYKRAFVLTVTALIAASWLVVHAGAEYCGARFLTVPSDLIGGVTAPRVGPPFERAQTVGLAEALTDRSPFNVDRNRDPGSERAGDILQDGRPRAEPLVRSEGGATRLPPPKLPGRHGTFATHGWLNIACVPAALGRCVESPMVAEQCKGSTAWTSQARFIPNYRKGNYEGFKLVGVRPGSLYRAMGIRSGDIVRSINGQTVDSPREASRLFNQLSASPVITLEVERRGKMAIFEYDTGSTSMIRQCSDGSL